MISNYPPLQWIDSHLSSILEKEKAIPLAIGGTFDHVHLAIQIKSNHALNDLVHTLKTKSSEWINENQLINSRFAWQNGYSGFTVSALQIDKVCKYISSQSEHHRTKSFQAELIETLKKQKIDNDPKELWD